MNAQGFLTALGLLATIIAIPVAIYLETQRKKQQAWSKPFAWGYFIITWTMVFYGVLVILCFIALLQDDPGGAPAPLLLLFALCLLAPVYAFKRMRWAWVVTSILTLDPLWWIINYVYGRNRWSEFQQGPPWAPMLPAGTPLSRSAERHTPTHAAVVTPGHADAIDAAANGADKSDAELLAGLASKLDGLRALHDSGVLSADEYAAIRGRLLRGA